MGIGRAGSGGEAPFMAGLSGDVVWINPEKARGWCESHREPERRGAGPKEWTGIQWQAGERALAP